MKPSSASQRVPYPNCGHRPSDASWFAMVTARPSGRRYSAECCDVICDTMLPVRLWYPSRKLLLCLSMSMWGCQADTVSPLSWTIKFDHDALRQRTAVVDVWIVRGQCTSNAIVYKASIAVDSVEAPAPPKLPKGNYGLIARARDAQCVWFAGVCAELDLPSSDSVVLVVKKTEPEFPLPTCSFDDPSTPPELPPESNDLPIQTPTPTNPSSPSPSPSPSPAPEHSVAVGGACQNGSSHECVATAYCKTPLGQCLTAGTCTLKPSNATCSSVLDLAIMGRVCGCDKVDYGAECRAALIGTTSVKFVQNPGEGCY